MALKLTYTDNKTGEIHADAYHRVHIGSMNHSKKEIMLVLDTYVSKTLASTKEQICRNKIYITDEDYNTFFSIAELDKINQNVIAQAYKFLLTIDPDAEGSKYFTFPFDYKNDSENV